MRSIPDALTAQKNLLASSASWLWLYDFFLKSGLVVARLTNNEEAVTFPTTDGDTYQPFPISFAEMEENAKGDLPTVQLTVGSVSGEIVSLMERYDGLADETVRVRLVNTAHLADGTATIENTFSIMDGTAERRGAVFTLASHPFFDLLFPNRRYSRLRCGWRYGGPECGWGFVEGDPDITPPGTVVPSHSCDGTIDGANGCRFHGQRYKDAGEVSLWPQRIGMFRSIPKKRGP